MNGYAGRRQYLFIIASAAALFVLNNLILGAVVPRLPGGSSNGITTMFVVTFVSLTIKRIDCIPLIYFIYALIGLPSHLFIGDWLYLVSILLLLVSAVIFNWLLNKLDYRITSYIIALPVFVIVLQAVNLIYLYFVNGQNPILHIDIYSVFLSLLMGYGGILTAFVFFNFMRSKRFIQKVNE
jgi:hypothetical protein